jgi:hypothetical protein
MAERRDLDWLLAPRRVFVLLAAMLAITLFVAPWPTREDSGGALTSFVASPAGARGFYEILDRLGHTVERRLTPMRDTLDTRALYVILEPSIPLTASEVHRLLETVRAGARLLTVPALGSRLADSLGVRRVPVLPEGTAGDGGRFGRRDSSAAFGPGWVRWVLRAPGPQDDDIAATFVPAADATTILWLNTRRGQEPMVVGLPYGRGRVLVAAEPGLFRNSTLRQEGGAVRAVRIVEWLTDGEGGPLVFDEYHHGYGAHASVLREARRALTDTTAGRLVLQIAVAGLVLLLAVGVRPIRPRPRIRIERRSPLEHVGALARAYAAVRATPRAAGLLVRGLQRRHRGPRHGGDELSYLRAIGRKDPAVQADVERISKAIADEESIPAAEVSASVFRIERALRP